MGREDIEKLISQNQTLQNVEQQLRKNISELQSNLVQKDTQISQSTKENESLMQRFVQL